jgi:membrane associated rhomboid family serine protease
VFIPLHDDVPMRRMRHALVSWGLIGLCVALFAASAARLLPAVEPFLAAGFGIIPKVVLGAAYLPEDITQAPTWATPLTNIFLHANWVHLIGNMLFLWVFGDNVEDDMGHVRFLVFYLLCGVVASLSHAWINAESIRPLIGASGAISGVVAAYLLLHPNVRIWGLVLKVLPVRLPAWAALGAWFAFQFGQGLFGSQDAVAWFAHVGGFLAGLALTPFFIARDISVRERWRAWRAT